MDKIDKRYKWGSIANKQELFPSIKYHHGFYFSDRAMLSARCLGWNVFFNLPWKTSDSEQRESCEWPVYGFYLDGSRFVISYGHKNKYIKLPWCREHYRSSYLMKDGHTWKHDGKNSIFYMDDESLCRETYPYTYTLRNGTVQKVKATILVNKREWRIWWLMKLPIFNLVRKTICIDFSGEVGERSGSWKGGTVGCSYGILNGETPKECLLRMGKERKFR